MTAKRDMPDLPVTGSAGAEPFVGRECQIRRVESRRGPVRSFPRLTNFLTRLLSTAALSFTVYTAEAAAFPVPEFTQVLPQAGVFPPDTSGIRAAHGIVPANGAGSGLEAFLAGTLLEEQGRHREAIAEFRKARAADSTDVAAPVAIARAYAEIDRPDSAEAWIRASLGLSPRNLEALVLAGSIDEGLGRLDSARVEYQRALQVSPDDPGAFMNLLSLLQRQGRGQEALDLIEQSRSPLLETPPLDFRKAQIQASLEKYPEAIESLAQVLKREPDFPDAVALLHLALARSADPVSAVPVLEEILSEQPQMDRVRVELAQILMSSDRWKDAIPHLQFLWQEHPKDEIIAAHLGALLLRADRNAEAQAALESAAGLKPDDPEPLRLLWQVASQSNRDQDALGLANRLVGLEPRDARSRTMRALSLAKLGHAPEALAAADSALGLDPGDNEAAVLASGILSRRKDYDAAARRVRTVIQAHPDDRPMEFRLGAILEEAGQIDSSLAVFNRMLAVDPDDAIALNFAGYMCIERGIRMDEAMDRVRRALKLQPDNPAFLDSYGWGLYRTGKAAEALDPLSRAASIDPENPEILKHLGRVQAEAGHKDAAADTYRRALRLTPGDQELQGWQRELEPLTEPHPDASK